MQRLGMWSTDDDRACGRAVAFAPDRAANGARHSLVSRQRVGEGVSSTYPSVVAGAPMKLPDNCQGCNAAFDVTRTVYEHHAMGLLCKTCMQFATALDTEVARLRQYAEQLADIEDSWTPRKAGSN